MAAAWIRNAELYTVGIDDVVVTCTTDPGVEITTRVGDHFVTTIGPYHHATVAGLSPNTTYALCIDGVEPDAWLPGEITTLVEPDGELLARFATVNDVHFGEQICGLIGGAQEVGPVFAMPAGSEAYPAIMNRSVIADLQSGAYDALLVKGDLTSAGTQDQYDQFLDAYGVFGERMHHIRGNHESYNGDVVANIGSHAVPLQGVVAVLLDTSWLEHPNGRVTTDQLEWLDAVCAGTTQPILVFGHHQLWDPQSHERNDSYFGVIPDSSEQLIDVFARHTNVGGYFAGHTHRNRVRRFPSARNIPIVEVASTKEYPGAYAEYRVYSGGYAQIGRRTAAPDAMRWAEATRGLYAGLYRDYALGSLTDRCFVERW